MIYSRRHPLNAMNRPSFIKKINLENFLKFPELPKSITTIDKINVPKLVDVLRDSIESARRKTVKS